jgi:hypothetical protein
VTKHKHSRIQGFVFGLYLRNQVLLTCYIKWLADGNGTSAYKRIMLTIIAKGVTKFALVAKQLADEEITRMIDGADRIGLTTCVCAHCGNRAVRESCLFIDRGFDAYRENGPYPLSTITRDQALRIVKAAKADGCFLVTPVNPLGVPCFPERYCICSCRADDCLPLKLRDIHGIREAWTVTVPKYEWWHWLILGGALLTFPLFLISLGIYRHRQFERRQNS